MNKRHSTLLVAGWLTALAASAQPYGMGPGMMGGGGAGGWGMGPGMMGGGATGYGMGPGMMGGCGPGDWGMGPGMMGSGGYGEWALEQLDLSADQRAKIVEIQKELSGKRLDQMHRMHELHWQQRRNAPGAFDEQAARASFAATTEARRQMFEASLDARKRIDAVLTPQQREQLARPRGRP
jgi:Spy/CpxP family protein refolding chaperone